MKNLFKKKNLNPQAPRQEKEIIEECQQLLAEAARAQYQVFVYSKQLEGINQRLQEVNIEASERKQLDAAVAKTMTNLPSAAQLVVEDKENA